MHVKLHTRRGGNQGCQCMCLKKKPESRPTTQTPNTPLHYYTVSRYYGWEQLLGGHMGQWKSQKKFGIWRKIHKFFAPEIFQKEIFDLTGIKKGELKVGCMQLALLFTRTAIQNWSVGNFTLPNCNAKFPKKMIPFRRYKFIFCGTIAHCDFFSKKNVGRSANWGSLKRIYFFEVARVIPASNCAAQHSNLEFHWFEHDGGCQQNGRDARLAGLAEILAYRCRNRAGARNLPICSEIFCTRHSDRLP